jgi:hypothetical protein
LKELPILVVGNKSISERFYGGGGGFVSTRLNLRCADASASRRLRRFSSSAT